MFQIQRTCWGQGPAGPPVYGLEDLEFRDLHSDLPLYNDLVQDRFSSRISDKEKFKALKLCIKKMKDHILHSTSIYKNV